MQTLSDFAGNGRVHLFAEFMGRRFYIESGQSIPVMEESARIIKYAMPSASYFLTDYAGSQVINGNAGDFQKAYKESK